jgi:hypothetical protein
MRKITVIDGIRWISCTRCKNHLPETEFHAFYKGLGGLHSVCKTCHASDARKSIRKQYKLNPERFKNKRRDPVKVRAKNLLNEAVKTGRIKKPSQCTECGSLTIIHGHHEDYSQPLNVVWLCPACHGRRHRNKTFH